MGSRGRATFVACLAALFGVVAGPLPAEPVTARDARAGCPPASEQLIEQGRKIFTGKGNCYTCHGPKADGALGLAPDLTDRTWIHIDGSFPAIVRTVRQGVPNPRQHPAPMPPKGGASLSEDEVCAVARYVDSLTP